MRRGIFWGVLVIALGLGLFIGWVDSRPTWDDTGITVGTILLTAGLLGAALPEHAWVWALAIGGWVPILGIALHGNFGSLIALAVAFAGAYGGYAVRKGLEALGRVGRA